LFASRIEHAVIAEQPSSDPSRTLLTNAAVHARSGGAEAFVVYDREPLFITALYSFTDAHEPDDSGLRTREAPYSPRHTAGIDMTWEDMKRGLWIALETFYTGEQQLEDDPYRSVGRPYAVTGLLVTQRFGRYKVFANVENLTGVRQTNYSPVLLAAPTPAGRWTTSTWAPAEGRVVSVGLRISGGDLAKHE
jgi:iron complex outermembrane receptor protein